MTTITAKITMNCGDTYTVINRVSVQYPWGECYGYTFKRVADSIEDATAIIKEEEWFNREISRVARDYHVDKQRFHEYRWEWGMPDEDGMTRLEFAKKVAEMM